MRHAIAVATKTRRNRTQPTWSCRTRMLQKAGRMSATGRWLATTCRRATTSTIREQFKPIRWLWLVFRQPKAGVQPTKQSSTIAQPILSGAFKSKKHKRQMRPRDLRFPIRQILRQLQIAPRPTVASLPRTSPLSDNNQNIQQGFVYKV